MGGSVCRVLDTVLSGRRLHSRAELSMQVAGTEGDDSAEVDVYNPTKNEWDKIPSMNQVHVGGSLAVLGGKLYVSGGYDNTFELSDVVEAYDPETRAWSVVGRLPEPTFWHGSVSIFRQFMPQTPLGGRGFELDGGSSDMDVGQPRPPQNPAELH
ncbi:hypothetical protein JEQ12_003751 [Ovis aries]|uniref:Kelch-like protein 21 n=1 Tax=Ovis aries TaxID=9940 RepID=A0A835ZWR9_SHEEP|nr:hypothetical protein JEQ12_003751 [Ovis aries]